MSSVTRSSTPPDGSVGTAQLGTGAVTEGKIGTGAVTEGKIGTGAVTEGKIGSLAVTEAKIGGGAVTTAKIGATAVTKSKLGGDSVTTQQMDTNLVSNAGSLAAGTGTVFSAATATRAFFPMLHGGVSGNPDECRIVLQATDAGAGRTFFGLQNDGDASTTYDVDFLEVASS